MTDTAFLEVYRSKSLRRNQKWRWRLQAINGSLIAESGEGYSDRAQAEEMGRKVVSGQYAQ